MRLLQKRPLTLRSEEFELLEDRLIINIKASGNSKQTSIDYQMLMAEPDVQMGSEKKLLVGAAFALMFSCILLVASIDQDDALAVRIIAALPMVLFLLLVWRYLVTKLNVWIFFYKNGAFAFAVDRVLPDSVQSDAFVTELRARIRSRDTSIDGGMREHGISAEIERLAKLLEKKLITDEEFVAMKQSLITQLERSGRSMGFHA